MCVRRQDNKMNMTNDNCYHEILSLTAISVSSRLAWLLLGDTFRWVRGKDGTQEGVVDIANVLASSIHIAMVWPA